MTYTLLHEGSVSGPPAEDESLDQRDGEVG